MPGFLDSEEFHILTKLYSHLKSGVALIDSEGRVQWLNEAADRLYPALRMADGLAMLIPNFLETDILTKLSEGEIVSADASETPLLLLSKIRFTPLFSSGQFVGSSVLFEGKKTEALSGSSEQAVTSFSSQIRGPLTIIFSLLSALSRRMEMEKDKVSLEYVRNIAQNCYKILRTSTNVSEITRYMDGNYQLKLSKGDLRNFVTNLCKAASILTSSIGIPLEYNMPNESIFTDFDADKLEISLACLISNACKYTKSGNTIQVTLTRKDDTAILSVSDKGIGIPSEALSHAFEPYATYHPDGNPYSSSGLGLSLVKYIAIAHGGTVAIQSEENMGTNISFTLPIHSSEFEVDTLHSSSTEYLVNRFSNLYIELSDVCSSPMP